MTRGPSPRRSSPTGWTVAAVAALVAGCASSAGPQEHLSSADAPIIAGKASDASQDAVVLLSYDPLGTNGFECSGTLLAPNLVLTARHCVSTTLDGDITCSGTNIGADYDPAKFYVITGPTRPAHPTGAAKGKQIFHDTGKNLCAHDLALILLDREIADAKIAPVRLDASATAGEIITAVGWGVTQLTSSPGTRQQRGGIKVQTVGPSDSTPFGSIAADEFMVGESICEGDSGGPALASTGAVIGVVSRGGNGTAFDPNDLSAGCIGALNLYSAATGFKQVILDAYAAAGQEPWLEGQPDPRLGKFGDPCTTNEACQSGLCNLDGKGGGVCTIDCTATACADGYDCKTAGDALVCVAHVDPPSNAATGTSSGGCAVSPDHRRSGPGAWIGLAVVGFAVMARRRRDGATAG